MKYAIKNKKSHKVYKIKSRINKKHNPRSFLKHKKSSNNLTSLFTSTINKEYATLKTTFSGQMVGDGVHPCMTLSTYMNSIYGCDDGSAFVSPANVRGLTILSTLFNDYLVHSSKINIRISSSPGVISNLYRDVRFYLVPFKSVLPNTSIESTIADMPQAKRANFQFNQNKPTILNYSQSCNKVIGIDKNQYRSCILTDTPTFLFGPSGALNSTTPTASGSIFWNLLCYDCNNTAFVLSSQYFEINIEIEYYAELVNRPQLTQT